MMKKGVLMTTLLFGLISGCLAPLGKIEATANPEVVAIKTGDESPVDTTKTGDHSPVLKVKTGDESPVEVSLKNEEFSYGTIGKVIVMGFAFLGLIGLDCWLCKRYRRSGKCR